MESINIDENLHLVESIFNEDSVESDILEIENQELVAKALSQLDDKYREVLVLKFLEQKDYKEISDILQKPMGTIATLINRAKQHFKKQLDKIN